ncbi:MAG: hypothetical protein A3J62_01275 [Candidatus Buchananbacteria bacterium RIFCSPHIGHO2_02_FULL_38_8]|uniref:DDH domain-containing protein n=2 Tax=Candidatus Buchananiibacteriota TaxID=1817903 RepID=A0A1G1XTG9_9BACT|nr:MAG: hypothetical protein A2731_00470 [Candidatus Buchananbacteria bacterium RIFCSPHIGHO2_01_FULL_39_8]OGY46983.1 MAG: hypothetical protein A3J62_01275 [Candidatus Buchananbacteria bacterium RIFCSPHIGHO2_02_FULL_38_8]
MDFVITAQKINQVIKQANNILLVAHQRPDADALGSLLGLTEWLDSLGKNYQSFCRDLPLITESLAFLFNLDLLETRPETLLQNNYDVVIVLDSGDLKYAGVDEVLPQLVSKPTLINIDHHATNDNFGDINLVNPQAVSTTEILYNFFQANKIPISPTMATGLLAGIIFDTSNFTNPNTTRNSLGVASRLLLAGARLPQINDLILKNKTIDGLRLWGKVLLRLNYQPEFSIASTFIVSQDLPDQKSGREIIEGIANFLNSLTGVKAILILYQEGPSLIKGSLRTNDDLIDVAELAKILGGGGHRKAAGFKIKGELVEIEGLWQII